MPLLAIRTHAKLFFVTFFGVLAIVAAIVLLLPQKYESYMKLLVKNDRQELVVSPETNVNTIHTAELSETRINSEIQLLRSVDILNEVVRKLGLDRQSANSSRAGDPSPGVTEKAVRKLERDLSIEPIKKSDVIQVSYRASSPALAVAVLRELAEEYLVEHIKVHGAPGTYGFFERQSEDYSARLALAERDLTQFRQRYSDFALPEEQAVFMEHALDAQQEREQAEAQVAQFKSKVRTADAKVNGIATRIVTQDRSIPNPTLVERLTTMLADLRNKRTDLLVKFHPDDRMVRDIDQQIADTEVALAGAEQQILKEQATDVNPVHQAAETQLVNAEVELAGLESRQSRLKQTEATYRDKLFKLASASVEMDDMARRLKENEENYLLYARKREEARIAESLDNQRIANVTIAENPTVPVEPSSPRLVLDLALGTLLAAFLGVAAVAAAEFLYGPTAERGHFVGATAVGLSR